VSSVPSDNRAGSDQSDAIPRSLLALLLIVAAVAFLWGVKKDLPWVYESDEAKLTLVAVQMAKSFDPDPGWFGHPGSTVLYPQAVAIQIDDAIRTGRPWLTPDPALFQRFADAPSRALLLGRLIAVAYAVLSLPLVFAIGNRAFGAPVGLVGAWLALLSPLVLDHAQMVRTDTAGVFFGSLALWLCLRLLDRPTLVAHVVTGLAIGIGIGTRYFLMALVVILLAVDLIHLRRAYDPDARRRIVRSALGALAAVAIGFAVSTPFFFLEIGTVLGNLAHEARETHVGQDGLGFAGNLGFYLRTALPQEIGLPQLALAAAGLVWALVRGRPEPRLLLAFVAIYLVGISSATLHWERWLIQIRPLVVLFAASAIVWGATALCGRAGISRRWTAIVIAAVVALASIGPARHFSAMALAQARPSTRVTGSEWIAAHVPAGGRVAAELYTAPLDEERYRVDYRFSLAEGVVSPETYRRAGYDYLMVSSAVHGRYFASPGRYPKEVAFYRALFRDGQLVADITPAPGQRGPRIRLYRLVRTRLPPGH
jgi:4-amino-4-deoxy-L-arabinose transferase-like glycosyltransferase